MRMWRARRALPRAIRADEDTEPEMPEDFVADKRRS